MPNLKIAWIAGLLLALGSAAWAQPTPPTLPAGVGLTQPLSLEACVAVALAASPQLAVAGQQVRSAQASVTTARAQGLPQLFANGQVSTSGGDQTGSTLGGSRGARTSSQLGLSLSESFYQSGRSQRIRATEAQAAGSRHGLTDTRRTLILAVATDYYTALAAQSLAQVAERAVEASTQHLAAAQARIAAGVAAPADRYPFDVELQSAVVASIAARNRVRTTLNVLKGTMGLAAETPLQLSDSLGRPALPTDLEVLRQQAYLQRPDVLRAQSQVDAARLSREVARLQEGPVLNVTASDDYGLTDGNLGNGWQGQVAVSLPIFDGGASRAATDSADAAWRIAQENLRQTELGVSQDVENNYLDASTAYAEIDAAQTALKAAQVNAAAAQERYTAGVATVIDVTDAEQKLRQAETDLITALYTYNTSLIALQAAVGVPQLTPPTPPTPPTPATPPAG